MDGLPVTGGITFNPNTAVLGGVPNANDCEQSPMSVAVVGEGHYLTNTANFATCTIPTIPTTTRTTHTIQTAFITLIIPLSPNP